MSDDTSLVKVNLDGDLTKPAITLVEKVSGAIGAVFEPWQIRRIAEAESDAERIKAISHIEIIELRQRAFYRFIAEESRKQHNIETIMAKAIPQLDENAQPQEMEDDWITNFFDKSRLVSDDEMQGLWAKILAEEANASGTFSKRTVNFLGSIDKSDALLFQTLCRFCWSIGGKSPLIYNLDDSIYKSHGIYFNEITHLDEIGLISFGSVSGYVAEIPSKKIL